MDDSITKNGVIFIAYLALMLFLFYILGGPIDTVMDGILSDTTVSQMATYGPAFKTAARLAFAIGITTPVVWFVVKMFSREPAYFYDKRRYR